MKHNKNTYSYNKERRTKTKWKVKEEKDDQSNGMNDIRNLSEKKKYNALRDNAERERESVFILNIIK